MLPECRRRRTARVPASAPGAPWCYHVAAMELLQSLRDHCPYCGEPIELLIDASAGAQQYVEDCAVCCQPMRVEAVPDFAGAGTTVRLRREDDA